MTTALNATHGAIEVKKEKLVADLKGVVADADDLLKEVAGSASDEFATARSRIETRLAHAISRLDDARAMVAEKARGTADAADVYVRDNPRKVLAIAVVAGLAIGYLLRRR